MRPNSLLLLSVLCTGCASSGGYVVLLPSEGNVPSSIEVSNGKGTRVLREAHTRVDLDEAVDRTPRPVSPSSVDADFAAAIAAAPPPVRHFVLYFETGATSLTDTSRATLDQMLRDIAAAGTPDIAVYGHTDRAGSEAGNVTLARQRAMTIKQLVAATGIDESLIEVASFGEHRPLIATADGTDEPRNRRVEVIIR